MRNLILISILILAIYLIVRKALVGPEISAPETGLEKLSDEQKVRALDELKVLYPKPAKKPQAPRPPKRTERPFFDNEKDDFERLEKIQYLDERGNPVNLNEEGEP